MYVKCISGWYKWAHVLHDLTIYLQLKVCMWPCIDLRAREKLSFTPHLLASLHQRLQAPFADRFINTMSVVKMNS